MRIAVILFLLCFCASRVRAAPFGFDFLSLLTGNQRNDRSRSKFIEFRHERPPEDYTQQRMNKEMDYYADIDYYNNDYMDRDTYEGAKAQPDYSQEYQSEFSSESKWQNPARTTLSPENQHSRPVTPPKWKSQSPPHPPTSHETPHWKPPGHSAPWKGQHATPHSPPSSREQNSAPKWKSPNQHPTHPPTSRENLHPPAPQWKPTAKPQWKPPQTQWKNQHPSQSSGSSSREHAASQWKPPKQPQWKSQHPAHPPTSRENVHPPARPQSSGSREHGQSQWKPPAQSQWRRDHSSQQNSASREHFHAPTPQWHPPAQPQWKSPRPAHSLSNSREHSQPQWKSPAKSSTHPPSSREHLHASAPQWKPPGQSAPWKGQHATPHSPPSSRERGTTPQWKSSTRPSSKGFRIQTCQCDKQHTTEAFNYDHRNNHMRDHPRWDTHHTMPPSTEAQNEGTTTGGPSLMEVNHDGFIYKKLLKTEAEFQEAIDLIKEAQRDYFGLSSNLRFSSEDFGSRATYSPDYLYEALSA